ncbi:unnamed protein product [Brachionus calyciflorus]|uniref:Uncharacterized protein n=1 Tax=Brachionus calyciflorus TaxID=104777 RepID=A0A813NEZ2_9BILA|nr:unnamed protein product [Brachionus calyciflorus]
MEIDLTSLFDHFYHTRFFVLICTSIFFTLFSLRLDQTIQISYWIVFTPLWLWKLTAFIGMIVGSCVWFRMTRKNNSQNNSVPFDRNTFVQFKSMLFAFLTNLLLLLFELIICYKLNNHLIYITWTICFIPLYILSILSLALTIWSIRYDRSYEIEIFCSLNILQFIFIALRLDQTIQWSWILVMIPMWLCMSIGLIILLYLFILTIISSRLTQRNSNGRELSSLQDTHVIYQTNFTQKFLSLLLKTILYFSFLTFLILLISKLDQQLETTTNNYNIDDIFINYYYQNKIVKKQKDFISYFSCTIPLLVSHVCLLLLSFSNRTGNVWWFGIQKDLCEYLINWVPWLKLYGNVKYTNKKSNRELNTEPDNSSLITFGNTSSTDENDMDKSERKESKLAFFFKLKNNNNKFKNEFILKSNNNKQIDNSSLKPNNVIIVLDVPD